MEPSSSSLDQHHELLDVFLQPFFSSIKKPNNMSKSGQERRKEEEPVVAKSKPVSLVSRNLSAKTILLVGFGCFMQPDQGLGRNSVFTSAETSIGAGHSPKPNSAVIFRSRRSRKLHGTHSHTPEGKWNITADVMVDNLTDIGRPVIRATSALDRGFLKSKGRRCMIHFSAESSNAELLCRTIRSANQLSIHGAVAT